MGFRFSEWAMGQKLTAQIAIRQFDKRATDPY
jgi:hypothetical protein